MELYSLECSGYDSRGKQMACPDSIYKLLKGENDDEGMTVGHFTLPEIHRVYGKWNNIHDTTSHAICPRCKQHQLEAILYDQATFKKEQRTLRYRLRRFINGVLRFRRL